MFRFCICFERKITEIMFIEIFDYQIAKNKSFDVCRHKSFNFQLLIKRLIKKKPLMQSNLQKIMYDTNNYRFAFNDDENLQILFRFQYLTNLSYVNLYMMMDFDFN